MHVAALLAQGAFVLKYTLPLSNTSCCVAYRAALALLLCYDVSYASKLLLGSVRRVHGWVRYILSCVAPGQHTDRCILTRVVDK